MLLLCLFLFLTTILAAPAAGPNKKRTISEDIFNNLVFFSQYSAAAYCVTNNDSPNNKIVCPAGNCPLIEADETTSPTEFENTLLTDTTGFVAVDSTRKIIVLSFRGSTSVRGFLTDATFPQLQTDLCMGCLAHAGFWTAWVEIRAQVMKSVRDARKANPDYGVVITGHSLGGAIAALAAAAFRKSGTPAALYTYGQPRVGNTLLSDYITKQAGGNFRVTHTDDPVPRLGPIVFNFVHFSPEYHITKGDTTVNPKDINIYKGEINFRGNTGTVGFDVGAHLNYFGRISACGPGLTLEKRDVDEAYPGLELGF